MCISCDMHCLLKKNSFSTQGPLLLIRWSYMCSCITWLTVLCLGLFVYPCSDTTLSYPLTRVTKSEINSSISLYLVIPLASFFFRVTLYLKPIHESLVKYLHLPLSITDQFSLILSNFNFRLFLE